MDDGFPPEKRRALECAVRLEEMLRAIDQRPQLRQTLGSLAFRYKREFSSYRELLDVIWIRDDIAHGIGRSSLQDWKYAIRVWEQATEDVQRKYDRTPHRQIQEMKISVARQVEEEPYNPEYDPTILAGIFKESFTEDELEIYYRHCFTARECPACQEIIEFDKEKATEGLLVECERCGETLIYTDGILREFRR
jgi:hypothetical protein